MSEKTPNQDDMTTPLPPTHSPKDVLPIFENVWEGVYQSFNDAPVVGEGFNSQLWADNSLERVKAILEQDKSIRSLTATVINRESLLPFLSSLLIHRSKQVKILDFGGGLGTTFCLVSEAIDFHSGLEYHIVDLEKIRNLGSQLFKDDVRVHFHSSLPGELNNVDIVHIESALQYVSEWQEILVDLAKYAPEFYLFTNLPAGDIPTYATTQQYYGSKIPYWFFNLDQVVTVISNLGYSLLFKSAFIHRILGKEQEYPQLNFPENLRLGHSCNLLFGRNDSGWVGNI